MADGSTNSYAVMRFQKYKIKDLGKIERHNNDRKHLKNRQHEELEHLNRTIKHPDKTLTQQIREKIKDIKKDRKNNTKRCCSCCGVCFDIFARTDGRHNEKKKRMGQSKHRMDKRNFPEQRSKVIAI